ncbi:MAG: hypothetical protein IPG24_26990 [Leptospiraceae bacterium]|nr:hypothetical protein [Leptospiraceae bacterium]
MKVTYNITNPEGENLETKEVELDEWGTYSGEFTSKNQDALGEYGINVSKGEQGVAVSGSAYFLLSNIVSLNTK